jgi:nucleoid DNA-binding protein
MAGTKRVARRCGLTIDDVRNVFDAIQVLLEEGEVVKVPNFGTFSADVSERRQITSPVLPGGAATSKRGRVVRFKMSQGLRDQWRME